MDKGNNEGKKNLTVDEFNRQSLITLNKKNPFVVPTNPGFFDPRLMKDYGYQKFDVIEQDNKTYLTVDRSIEYGNRKVELNTSVYELDENSTITKLTGSIKKKIRSILPVK